MSSRSLFGLVLTAWLCGVPAAQESPADALRRDLDFARRKVYPALVNIAVVFRLYSGGRTHRSPAAGSGVIVSPAGHVLTNFHVAGDTTRIACTLPTGETIPATVVAHDPLTDLSVLKLELSARADVSVAVPFATLGDSDALSVGDYVLAMGNPLTLSSSMTLGIVSNTRRVFTDFTGTDIDELDLGDGEVTGIFTRWIQHDALILPGNSGGPLVNLRGEVVGINELGGGGVGFAIPSDLAAKVLNQALTYGEVRRGWLGVTVLPVEKIGRDRGALVSYVAPGTPAAAAGLRAGDIITALGGEPVTVRFFEEVPLLYQRIAEMKPGTRLRVDFERDGATSSCTAELGRMEKFLGKALEFGRAGVTLREITGPMALARRYPSTDGLLVTGVRPGYPFEDARPAIQEGDVILQFAGKPVRTLAQFGDDLAAASGEVAVAYRRDRESLLTVVDLTKEPPRKPGRELPKPWLGVDTQVLTTKVAKALGLEGRRGFRITDVMPWTKAAAAGLRTGDVITAVDGEALDAYREQDARDLVRRIEDMAIGEEAELTVVRDGKDVAVTVVLEETPQSALDAKTAKNETFEFGVRETTFLDRVRFRWPKDQSGVLVTEVTNGSIAHIGGLRANDLIVSIDGKPIGSVAEFEAVMAEIEKKRPDRLQIFVRRGHRTHFVFLEPDWEGSNPK